MAFKTEAIVLHARELRDADRMYELLSPSEGRISAVARSSARSMSKLAGHLQPFTHVRLMIGRGRQDYLAGAATIRSFRTLRETWFDFILTSSLVELLMRFNVAGQQAQAEFELLLSFLGKLEDAQWTQKEKVVAARIFLWKILALAGWEPNFDLCVVCREPLSGSTASYEALKGFVCGQHGTNGIPLTHELVSLMREVLRGDEWDSIVTRTHDVTLDRQWFALSQQYYQDIISYPLSSLRLFNYV